MIETFTKLNIIGCGGHARSAADIIFSENPYVKVCFYDDNAQPNETILGEHNVFMLSDISFSRSEAYFIGVGDNSKREQLFKRFGSYNFISIVSKTSYVSSTSTIGSDCFIGRMAQLGPEAHVEDNCIINDGAIVEHECVIGRSSHISVGSKICGRSIIGERVFVGAGATVIDKISICNDVLVGAGAVVTRNITVPGIYVGTPAHILDKK